MKSRTIPLKDRVTEAIFIHGPETVSDARLIAALLNPVSILQAEAILKNVGSLTQLISAGPAQLREWGLCDQDVDRFSAIPELFQRMLKGGDKRPVILSAFQAVVYLRPRCLGWMEEHFGMLALNAKGEVIADREISKGTATGTLITPREFYREALRYGAISVLAWHNHPSGEPTPSREDCILTKRLRDAGHAMGVPLSDHIIIGHPASYSFREVEGWDG